MTTPLDRIVALAQTRVRAHVSRSKSGKVEFVDPHLRLVKPSAKHFVTRPDDARVTQGQTPTNFWHPVTGHNMGKTETGDTYERMFMSRFARRLLPRLGRIRLVTGAGGGTSRTTALDAESDTLGIEIKTISVRSKNQKSSLKGKELRRKLQAVADEGLEPYMIVQVVDQDRGVVSVHGMARFGSKAVSTMEHFGDYKYTPAQFQRAQELSGHWAKKEARLAAQRAKRAAAG